MYSLEYEMMVQTLHVLRFSGEFQADLPSQSILRGGGRVVLLVRNGYVLSCFILDRNGQKIYHDAEAQQLLPRFGILDWKLTSSASHSSVLSSSPPVTSTARPPFGPLETARESNRGFIPRRLAVSEVQWRSWSALERAIYSLIDGTHSVEQIALLLSRPISTIEQVLRKFEALGIIMRLS